jgi:hypothetical protein
MAGSIVPAVLISAINSDLPRPILAQVSQNVLESATSGAVLIPQGSRLSRRLPELILLRSATGSDRLAAGHLSQRLEHDFAVDAGC